MAHSGFVDPSRPSLGGPDDAPVVIYGYAAGYVPAIALCGLGVLTFLITLLVHITRTVRARVWFTVPFILACFAEMLGYVFRTLSSQKDPYKISWFVAQYFLITTAPILITASMYISLTRLLRLLESTDVRLPALFWTIGQKVILWIFITADVVTTIVQIAGSAMIGVATSKHKDPASANNVVLAGIAIQTVFFCVYFTILTGITIPVTKHRAPLANSIGSIVPTLWLASVFVLVRLIFRLAESGDGVFGFVWTHEALFGALEFFPILMAMVLTAVWHPGRTLSRGAVKSSTKTGQLTLTSLA